MTQYLATCKTHSVVRIYVICDVCVCLSARHLIWNWIMFMFGIISIVFYVRSASAIISHHKYSTTHGHSVAESIYNSQYRQQFIHKILRLSRVWCVFSPIFFYFYLPSSPYIYISLRRGRYVHCPPSFCRDYKWFTLVAKSMANAQNTVM